MKLPRFLAVHRGKPLTTPVAEFLSEIIPGKMEVTGIIAEQPYEFSVDYRDQFGRSVRLHFIACVQGDGR